MPAWVAEPGVALDAARQDDLQKEWQEARAVVDRLDATLVDLRKYGFGLATGLLTFQGVIFTLAGRSNSAQAVAVVVAVTMLLAAVLFVVDQYYHMIQWSATNRATVLETYLCLGLSKEILRWARWELPPSRRPDVWATRFIWKNLAPIQYGSFITVGAALAIALMQGEAVPSPQHGGANFMWIVLLFSFFLIGAVRWLAGRERDALTARQSGIAGDIRVANAELVNPPTVAGGATSTAFLSLLPAEPDLTLMASPVAVVKPAAQGRLSIVACSLEPPRRIRITFLNPGPAPVIPIPGERYQIFVG